jgi:hypothetical protein
MNNTICKHRRAILAGEDPGIVEGDRKRLREIAGAAAAVGWPALDAELGEAKARLLAAEKGFDLAARAFRETHYRIAAGDLKTERLEERAREKMGAALEAATRAYLEHERIEARAKGILIAGSY